MKKAIPITTKELSKLAAAINVSNELNGRKQQKLSALPASATVASTGSTLPTTPVKAVAAPQKVAKAEAPGTRAAKSQKTAANPGSKRGPATSRGATRERKPSTARKSRNHPKLVVKARIMALAQLLSCSPNALVQYLTSLFLRQFTPTTLLYQEELTAVLTRYSKPEQLTNVEIVDALPVAAARRTSENSMMLLFDENIFEQVRQTVAYNRMRIDSHFTDEQALAICGKMADSYARTLVANYRQLLDKESIQASIYRYQLHYLAEKARRHYGGNILTFLYQLRPLKFSNRQAYSLQPDKDLASIDADFPALTFANRRGEEYTLVFHLVSGLPIKNPSARVSVFGFRSGRGTVLGAIDKSGYMLDVHGQMFSKLQQVNSSLLIFCSYMKGSRQMEFFTGVESGKCFVCNRPLTEPISVRYGIGPVCLLRLGGL